MAESVEKTRKERLLEVLSLFMTLGMIAAIGTLLFLGWLTDQVFEGDMRRFDDVTRAAVHTTANPTLTLLMRFMSFVGSTFFLTAATIAVIVWFALRRW